MCLVEYFILNMAMVLINIFVHLCVSRTMAKMLLFFLIQIGITVAGRYLPCDPLVVNMAGCICMSPDRPQINCYALNLTTVPRFGYYITSTIHTLILSRNSITKLAKNNFRNMNDLQRLLLDQNNISVVDEYVFNGIADSLVSLNLSHNNMNTVPQGLNSLNNLKYLDLSYNYINTVEHDSLRNLNNIRELYLQGNSIIYYSNTFNLMDSSLRVLALTFDAQVESSPPNAYDLPHLQQLMIIGNTILERTWKNRFPKFSSLKYLTLSHCGLSDDSDWNIMNIESLKQHLQGLELNHNEITLESIYSRKFKRFLKNMFYLKYLDLSFNQIRKIKEHIFTKLTHLEVLSLQSNKLIFFSNKAVNTMSHLKTLDLRNNHLKTLDAVTIVKSSWASLILLEGNLWNCSCLIKGVKDVITEQLDGSSSHLSVSEIYHSLTCASPLPWQGQLVKDVMLECREEGQDMDEWLDMYNRLLCIFTHDYDETQCEHLKKKTKRIAMDNNINKI